MTNEPSRELSSYHSPHDNVVPEGIHKHELVLLAPFQRNPVWTNLQKSYLIDTVLNGLPIPELYMQDVGNKAGEEKHIVVDGQQRIRATLDYVMGNFRLQGDDVAKQWRDLKFDDLGIEDKKAVFS